MLKKSITVSDVCDLLNELIALDYDCAQTLISTRVRCNVAVANHPTMQVQHYKSDEFPKVGIVGIINGMFGIREDGMGAICFVVDDKSGKILRFEPTPQNTGKKA